jgi:hypothetical protein
MESRNHIIVLIALLSVVAAPQLGAVCKEAEGMHYMPVMASGSERGVHLSCVKDAAANTGCCWVGVPPQLATATDPQQFKLTIAALTRAQPSSVDRELRRENRTSPASSDFSDHSPPAAQLRI